MTYAYNKRKEIRSAIRIAEKVLKDNKVLSPTIKKRLKEAESLAQGELDRIKRLLKEELF